MSLPWHGGDAPLHLGAPVGVSVGGNGGGYGVADSVLGGAGGMASATAHNDQIRNTLATYFGAGQPVSQQRNYFQGEYQDYAEAFRQYYGGADGAYKDNSYLSRVMIEKTCASGMWPLKAAPLTQNLGPGIVFEWDTVTFDQHLLDREPEESTPRLMTSRRQANHASLARFGIALMLEVGFASTPAGRMTYVANMEQIRVATVESICYGAVVALVEHERYVDQAMQDERRIHGGSRTREEVSAMFAREKAQWAVVNKSATGLRHIISSADISLRNRPGSITANLTVVPEGVGQYLLENAQKKFYLDGGNNIGDKLESGNCVVVESRSFTNGIGQPRHDPFYRQQTIGGFAVLNDSTSIGCDLDQYRTSHLDSIGYNEASDNIHMSRYADLYTKAGLWNFDLPGAKLTTILGQGVVDDLQVNTWGQLHRIGMRRPDDAIERIVALSNDKRRNFVAALRLFPVGHPLTLAASTGERYSTQAFRHAVDATAYDMQYSVHTRGELDARIHVAGPTHAGDEAQAYARATNQRRREQSGAAYDDDGDDYYYHGREGVDSNGDNDDDADSDDDDDHGASNDDDEDGRYAVESAAAAQPARRVVNHAARTVTTYAAVAPVVRRLRVRRAPHETSVLATHESRLANLVLQARQATGTRNSQARNLLHFSVQNSPGAASGVTLETFVASHVDRITVRMDSLTIEQQCSLVDQLRSAVTEAALAALSADERSNIAVVRPKTIGAAVRAHEKNADFHERAVSVATAAFAPAYARVQTLACVRENSRNVTLLERHVASDAIVDLAATAAQAPPHVLNCGWWNPSALKHDAKTTANEDGQVLLAFTPSRTGADMRQLTLPIEHDAFAITLAKSHTVYFGLEAVPPHFAENEDREEALVIACGTNVHRTRRDALVWSVFASYIAAGWIGAYVPRDDVIDKSDLIGDEPFIAEIQNRHDAAIQHHKLSKSLRERLIRHAATASVHALLPTQLHMRSVHERTMRYMDYILANKDDGRRDHDFYVCTAARHVGLINDDAGDTQDTLRAEDHARAAASLNTASCVAPNAITPLTPLERSLVNVLERDVQAHVVAYDAEIATGMTPAFNSNTMVSFVQAQGELRKIAHLASSVFIGVRIERRPAQLDAFIATAQYEETYVRNIYAKLSAHYGSSTGSSKAALVTETLHGSEWNMQFVRSLLDRASLSCGELWRFAVENDIPVPFALNMWRPNKSYRMGSLMHARVGIDGAAVTPYKNPNFMMADNAAQKMIYGHFTIMFKTIVTNPAMIVVAENVFCNAYLGGNGVETWDPLSEDHVQSFGSGNLICDVFVTVNLMAIAPTTTWRSVTGTLPRALGVSEDVAEAMLYPGCDAFASFWKMSGDVIDTSATARYHALPSNIAERKFNVVCMQELQLRWDPREKRMSSLTPDAGHFGDRVYPGCGLVRKGHAQGFEVPWYATTRSITLS